MAMVVFHFFLQTLWLKLTRPRSISFVKLEARSRTNRELLRSSGAYPSLKKFKPKENAVKKLSIGMDAHKVTNVIGLAFVDMSKPILYKSVSADLRKTVDTIRHIQKLYDVEKEDLCICYEAGPTGFVLARRLIQLGYDCIAVAPSLIPTKAGDRKKTDRRDARKLAGLLRAGELTAVHIPDVEDEVIRDVCRGRSDAVQELVRAKKQLLAFLLRNGANCKTSVPFLFYINIKCFVMINSTTYSLGFSFVWLCNYLNGYRYKGDSNWTEAHMRFLRELVFPHCAQKMILEEYIQRIDAMTEQIKRIEEQMNMLLETWKRKPLVEALMGMRGFKVVAAMVMISEIGYFGRFKHPKQLMAYLGLMPTEESSGEKWRMGSITKCGNGHARWMLIECAGHYRMHPKISKALSKRQEGLSRKVRKVSWHAQNRLSKLALRGMHFNKIRTAIARELSSYIWDLAMLIEQPQPCPSRAIKA
jgi:transposase